MLRSKTYRSILVLSPVALVALAVACGNDTGTPSGTGGATGSGAAPSTGGTAGSGTSGSSNTGGSTGNTGGSTGNAGGSTGNAGGSTGNAGGTSGAGGTGAGGGGAGGTGGGTGGGGVVPGTSGYNCEPASGEVPALQATSVASGITEPILVAHEPNAAAGRLMVLERAGRIRLIENGSLVATPFLDFSGKADPGSPEGGGGDERGALGLAFHPDYATNGLFYVHYSDENSAGGDSVFEEYKVSSDPNVADPNSARLVLKVTQPVHGGSLANHKGGAINFGADGFLYIGLGDGGGSNDPDGNGQSLTTLLGKILRIDPVLSGSDAYSAPAGNLKDTMSNAAPEIWDYGLRNPFRFTFDGCTGDLYIGDVGQNAYEEVDVEEAGDGGKNYGWKTMEGTHCFQPMSGCNESGITQPVLDYGRSAGTSITGGAVYRGSSIPSLRGAYFYADFGNDNIWMTVYNRDTGMVSTPVSVTQDLNNVTNIVSITNGPDGELYFVGLGNGTQTPGAVYKLEAAQ